MESQKGYSLVEIVIGLAIILIFIYSTGSLINASYTNYRLVLQRNEAMDFAINEMEKMLGESGDKIIEDYMGKYSEDSSNVVISDVGYTKNSMEARTRIEKVKSGQKIYDDKVFIVSVNVSYSRTANDTKKYNLQLQSLKVIK